MGKYLFLQMVPLRPLHVMYLKAAENLCDTYKFFTIVYTT